MSQTLQQRLLAAGLGLEESDFDYQGTDLYVRGRPRVYEWFKTNYEFYKNITSFVSRIEGDQWFEIPFAYVKPSPEPKKEAFEELETDLFDAFDILPENIREIIERHTKDCDGSMTKEQMEAMTAELKPLGYSFDWGLDMMPYDLKYNPIKYYSIRVVRATSEAEAVLKVENQDFDESDPLCDKVIEAGKIKVMSSNETTQP